MRSLKIGRPGIWRLARRDCELYSVQILSAGAFGAVRVLNGQDRVLFHQPSTFTGSFWLGAGAEGGLVVELYSIDMAPNLTINWRVASRDIEA